VFQFRCTFVARRARSALNDMIYLENSSNNANAMEQKTAFETILVDGAPKIAVLNVRPFRT
jgi:hypothetical protein